MKSGAAATSLVALASGVFLLAALPVLSSQVASPRFLSHAEAAPIFAALGEGMPSAAEWPRWIAAADAATRARVAAGDEGAVVNLVLFGTSFTKHPRVISADLSGAAVGKAVDARIDDLERALAKPPADERLQFARQVIGTAPVRGRVLAMIDRVVKEGAAHAALTKDARSLGDSSLEFAERSRLYRGRGLATDSSVRINLAIEDALRQARAAGTLQGVVGRVGIVGPGLDFVDKEAGYDFYPPQTIQPFAVIDSLARLGLADADTLHVATFDVSARVNSHIDEMARRARKELAYLLHLPLQGDVAWRPEMLDYFSRFGNAIGRPVPATIPPGLGPLRFRIVAVRPSVVLQISSMDVNITAQAARLADTERFDLIVGTNVFLYYDRLEQGLAMASMAAMLRPGGLLLSNNALVEIPSSGMRSVGYSRTLYSNREEDGDLIIWYRKQ